MITLNSCLLAVGLLLGCAEEDAAPFACGDNGGSCDAATQLCVLGGPQKCSTCVPLPAACEDNPTCGCVPPGTDASYGARVCQDAGSCAVTGDGLTLTCAEVSWGCGWARAPAISTAL